MFPGCECYSARADRHHTDHWLGLRSFQPITMPINPISAAASTFSVSIKILEFSFQLKAVGEQTADLLRMAEHVNRNVDEARRLRCVKASLISADNKAWMDEQINDCEEALREVQQLLEPARVSNATKSVNPKSRALWVLRDGARAQTKNQRLSACHQTINTVIGVLQARDVVVVAPLSTNGPFAEPPPYTSEMEAMFSWRSQMRSGKRSFDDCKSNGLFTVPTSSVSAHLSPELDGTNALIASSKEGQRPFLVSSMSETALKTTSPTPYSFDDGVESLPVLDSSSKPHTPLDIWSLITFSQTTDDLSLTLNFPRVSRPFLPWEDTKTTSFPRVATTEAGPANGASAICKKGLAGVLRFKDRYRT